MHFGWNETYFLLQGLKWTFALVLISFAGGSLLGLAVALLRTSSYMPVRIALAIYVGIFQGTPTLMQLFVIYYGVALFDISIDAWAAVAIAFSLHASAFLGDIWRGSIEALPIGQKEASDALGLHYFARMKNVILPQAFRISLPATVGFLVQQIKGTSLASIVGFIELTRAGQIVANQTFEPILVYGIVGAIYFVICWPLSIYGSRLGRKLSKAAR